MTARAPLLLLLIVGCVSTDPLGPPDLYERDDDDGGASSSSAATSGAATSSAATTASSTSAGTGGSAPACGDGNVDAGEECDDDNTIDDDGCSACEIDCAAGELKAAATGHCYALFVATTNQADAAASCQAWGGAPGLGHLASMGDAVENTFVASVITGTTWIGADDLGGDWAWPDGTPFVFENWQDAEPNHPGEEHCMFMDVEAKWHDHDCADLRSAYLCERVGAGTQ